MIEHNDVVEPTPQDYGFPENPSVVNQQCWDRQQAFLKAFGQLGTIRAAARTIGIHRSTVNLWLSTDLYSFKKRMADAKEEYREFLEDLIHEWLTNPQGNRGSDVLLMFREKVEWPEKYREEVKVLRVSAQLQMPDRLKQLAEKDMKRLEAETVEGEFREMPGSGGIETRVSGNPGSVSTRVGSPAPDYPASERSEPPDTRVLPPPPRKPAAQRRQARVKRF
jgi:hypothetical protein